MLFKLFSFAQMTVKKTKTTKQTETNKQGNNSKKPNPTYSSAKQIFKLKKNTRGTELVLLMPSQDIIVKYIS